MAESLFPLVVILRLPLGVPPGKVAQQAQAADRFDFEFPVTGEPAGIADQHLARAGRGFEREEESNTGGPRLVHRPTHQFVPPGLQPAGDVDGTDLPGPLGGQDFVVIEQQGGPIVGEQPDRRLAEGGLQFKGPPEFDRGTQGTIAARPDPLRNRPGRECEGSLREQAQGGQQERRPVIDAAANTKWW